LNLISGRGGNLDPIDPLARVRVTRDIHVIGSKGETVNFIRKFNVVFSIIGGYILLFLSFLIVFEIIARKIFNYSLQGVDEMGGYIVAITGTFGFAYALIERTHTRIDIILDHVPAAIRNLLNLLAYALVTGGALFMLRYGYEALSESILFKSLSPTPLQVTMWIPQSMWVAGLIVFAITAVAMLVHLLVLQFKNPGRGFHLYGPPTVEEEVEREMAQAEARKVDIDNHRLSENGDAS
jgi:TRAP-type C4-dicarboxylate transport system permease small subunit